VALAAGGAVADDGVIIDVSGAKRGRYPIAIPVAVDSDGAIAAEVASVASFDLGVAGYFKVLDPASFLADLGAEKLGLDPQKWKDVGAYGVIKYRVVTTGDRGRARGAALRGVEGRDSGPDQDLPRRQGRPAVVHPRLVQRGREVLHRRLGLLRLAPDLRRQEARRVDGDGR
jgi:hypothetical protein